MLATLAPYLMSLSAMSFAALSAVTLIRVVNRFDPPGADAPVESVEPQASPVLEKSHGTVAA